MFFTLFMIRKEIVDREKSEKIEDGRINDTHFNENRSSRHDDFDRRKSRGRYNIGKFNSRSRGRFASTNSGYNRSQSRNRFNRSSSSKRWNEGRNSRSRSSSGFRNGVRKIVKIKIMENIIEVEDKDLMEDRNIMVKSKVADLDQKVMMDGDTKIKVIKYLVDNKTVDS